MRDAYYAQALEALTGDPVDQGSRPIFIFDIDGTIADIDHRVPLLKEEKMAEFWKACVHDKPRLNVLKILQLHLLAGAVIWFWTGRDEVCRTETIDWLTRYLPDEFPMSTLDDVLLMRKEGSSDHDDEIKAGWYDAMPDVIKRHIVGVYEDRDKVVKMWRDKGVTCLQVNYGEF